MLLHSTWETLRKQRFCSPIQFQFWLQVWHPHYGSWEHIPPHVWTIVDASNSTATQDDRVDEVDVCALCSQKHTTTVCGECNGALVLYQVSRLYATLEKPPKQTRINPNPSYGAHKMKPKL